MSEALLSPIATFLLGVAALLRLTLHVRSPIKQEIEKYEGMTEYQIQAQFAKELKKDRTNVIIRELWELEYTVVLMLSVFIIDPIVAIIALTRNIGYQPIACAMLTLAAITGAIWIRNFALARKASNHEPIDPEELEHVIPVSVIALADKLKLSERARYWIRRIYTVIPDFYIWYLILVVLLSF